MEEDPANQETAAAGKRGQDRCVITINTNSPNIFAVTYTASVPRNKYFGVTHHLSPQFTGQEQVGRQLASAFLSAHYGQAVQRRFVLFGMGGAGKTQICLNYIQSHRERCGYVHSCGYHGLANKVSGTGVYFGSMQAAMRASNSRC